MLDARWAAATQALRDVFMDEAAAGMSAGLTFFPVGIHGCDPGLYSNPAVGLGTLIPAPAPADVHENLLLSALGSFEPHGLTPMVPALSGAFDYLAAQPVGEEHGALELVLVTDGFPTGCDGTGNDIDGAVTLAHGARQGPSMITTHAIGIGIELEDSVKAIATAGGGKSVVVNSDGDLRAFLYEALVATTRSCTYFAPATVHGLAVRRQGGDLLALSEVSEKQHCEQKLAWHKASSSSLVVLCPTACAEAARDGSTVVAVCAR